MVLQDGAFWLSLIGLLTLSVIRFRKTGDLRTLLLCLAVLAVSGVSYFIVFESNSEVQSKGDQPSGAILIIVLYGCMLLGMVCHYFCMLLLTPSDGRPPFEIAGILAPIFASPLVFIPLLGAMQNANIDLSALTLPKFMVFFVAWENGFFWKEIFDNRRKQMGDKQRTGRRHER
jgi:hypothetical protein